MDLTPKLLEYPTMSAHITIGKQLNFPVKIERKDYLILPIDLDFRADLNKTRPTSLKITLVVTFEVQTRTAREVRRDEVGLDFA